jgi:hypothetical protein
MHAAAPRLLLDKDGTFLPGASMLTMTELGLLVVLCLLLLLGDGVAAHVGVSQHHHLCCFIHMQRWSEQRHKRKILSHLSSRSNHPK